MNAVKAAIRPWRLVKPRPDELPLKMGGGSTETYVVVREPEDSDRGTVSFHNYSIESDHDDGAKDIDVPLGTSVTYTARKNGSRCPSDWVVNGETNKNSSSIIFNRNWWNVPGWFLPSVDTPRPDVYDIDANDVQQTLLHDSGCITVIGVKKISGPNGKTSERVVSPSRGELWCEHEVIYVQPRAVFTLFAELGPGVPVAEIDKIKGSIAWTAGSGRIEQNSLNPLAADCCAPDDEGMYVVTASFGNSKRIILVKVTVLKIHEDYELAWEVGFGESGTVDEGLSWHRSWSQHELYLTYKAEEKSFETVFHITCTSARGKNTDATVIEGVWSGFEGRDVKRKDNALLHYYRSYRTRANTLQKLLWETEGQCYAWASFLRASLKVQGIDTKLTCIKPLDGMGDGFLVKNWSFSGSGTSGNSDFPYKNERDENVRNRIRENGYGWGTVVEVCYTSGTPGQNNVKPAALFKEHWIVHVPSMNAWYDPSYGLKHMSLQSFDGALSGVLKNNSETLFIRKNPIGVQIQFLEGDDYE